MTRYAVIRYSGDYLRAYEAITRYLPDNYRVRSTHPDPSGSNVVIEGEDVAGWTLDGYVLPRLASGLYHGREYPSAFDAEEHATASMN